MLQLLTNSLPQPDFENLDFQDCKRTHENPDRKLQETSHQSEKGSFTGRQIAWVIYNNFKTSGENGAILDVRVLSKVQLKNDNVQAFDAKWDEVLSSVTNRFIESMLESLYKMQVEKSRKN